MGTRVPCNAKSGCANAPATGEYTIRSERRTVSQTPVHFCVRETAGDVQSRPIRRRHWAWAEPGVHRIRITVIVELGRISVAKDRTAMTSRTEDQDRDRTWVFKSLGRTGRAGAAAAIVAGAVCLGGGGGGGRPRGVGGP